ncbi:MAG: cytochrome c biogenesis protein CcdA [Acidobacteria bacterium]|nr:cytochrome c biogenesis protein CcdA [Acidobacteriota bacterium]
MIDIELAYPFSLGLVAAFNPCGFAMLPTYLAYFISDDTADGDGVNSTLRGLTVGLIITASFVLVFGLIGIVTRNIITTGAIEQRLPWVTLGTGILLLPLGVAMLAGYEPRLNLPRLDKGGRSRNLGSVFVFGISFAIVSFGCTAPLFLSAITTSFTDQGFVEGVGQFLAYALGMGSVVLFLTLSISMARDSVARKMRSVLPYINRISGGMLMFAGVYLLAYGWYEIQVFRDPVGVTINPAQARLDEFQAHLSAWVTDVSATHIGLVLVLTIVGMVLWGMRPVIDPVRFRWYSRAFATLVAGIEILGYQGELITLPTIRLIASIPQRVGHWFTDPLRWGVILEMAGVALLAWALHGLAKRLRHNTSQAPVSVDS